MAPLATFALAAAVDELVLGDDNPNGLQAAKNQGAHVFALLHAHGRHLTVHGWWHHLLNGNLPLGFCEFAHGNFLNENAIWRRIFLSSLSHENREMGKAKIVLRHARRWKVTEMRVQFRNGQEFGWKTIG